MPLPEFTETVARFGTGSDCRKLVARRLERIYHIASQTGSLARCVVFGLFVTDKHELNDVDVFMIMDDNFDVGALNGESRRYSSIMAPRKTTSGPASSGCAEWRPSVVNRPRSKIGKSNVMALHVASSKSR